MLGVDWEARRLNWDCMAAFESLGLIPEVQSMSRPMRIWLPEVCRLPWSAPAETPSAPRHEPSWSKRWLPLKASSRARSDVETIAPEWSRGPAAGRVERERICSTTSKLRGAPPRERCEAPRESLRRDNEPREGEEDQAASRSRVRSSPRAPERSEGIGKGVGG